MRQSIEAASRARELTMPLVEAAYESATYRHWVCPVHGPVELEVNALNQCVRAIHTDEETGEASLCGQICERNGPLLRSPKEIGAVLSTFTRNAGGLPVVLQDLGVSKTPNTLTYNDNRKVEMALPLWLYDMLTPAQKDAYAAKMAVAAEGPKLIEAVVKDADPEVSNV